MILANQASAKLMKALVRWSRSRPQYLRRGRCVMNKRYGRFSLFARLIVTILALSLLSGCVIVPRGGYYHPWGYGWHRGWRR
uniref:Putative lipoprotein transmembrane (Modular protein) n=1 Tax=mine drainage metagenome TaxID=410659 RepID=E6QAD8_9ZZZZ